MEPAAAAAGSRRRRRSHDGRTRDPAPDRLPRQGADVPGPARPRHQARPAAAAPRRARLLRRGRHPDRPLPRPGVARAGEGATCGRGCGSSPAARRCSPRSATPRSTTSPTSPTCWCGRPRAPAASRRTSTPASTAAGRCVTGRAGSASCECAFHGFCWSLQRQAQAGAERVGLPAGEAGRVHAARGHASAPGAGSSSSIRTRTANRWRTTSATSTRCSSAGRWTERYTRVHISKVLRTNWKVAQEAFMESFHVITTHPQLLPGFGDANSQYDVFGNVSRAISAARRAQPLPALGARPSRSGSTPRSTSASTTRRCWRCPTAGPRARRSPSRPAVRCGRCIGDGVEELTDAELVDSHYLSVFPNMHPWGGYNQITYRWRPNGDDHESCIMDVFLLSPFAGERPPPAPRPATRGRRAMAHCGGGARLTGAGVRPGRVQPRGRAEGPEGHPQAAGCPSPSTRRARSGTSTTCTTSGWTPEPDA